MSVALQFDQSQVNTGLITATCTMPTTLPGNFPFGGLINVKIQYTVPEAIGTGTGAGSGKGLGAGAGGGGEGFTGGDLGTGHGGTGQGFGSGNGYQQPPAYTSANAINAGTVSDLTITVVNTTQTITYLSTSAPATYQSAAQYQCYFTPAAGDVITITFSSSNASDKVLNGLQSIISIGQGQN